ncbi:MAG: HEAT repeat domain-containing protein, partial [Deltaproteobacteria bacterium]|nr:HEAT repeat domain-containing protein [Deltaproteobacteria bacterium]
SRAAEALGSIGDSRAVEPLITTLKDENSQVRSRAAEALGKIGDKKAIQALTITLQDWYAGKTVANALSKLGWQPNSIEDKVHFLVAERKFNNLIMMWDQTKKVLSSDVMSNKFKVVNNATCAFLRIGKQEIIPRLLTALNQRGSKDMALVYLNSGHSDLQKAATDWAHLHGYTISTLPGSNINVHWGSR